MKSRPHLSSLAPRPHHGFWFGLASLAIILLLAACGSSGSAGTTPTPATSGGGTTPTPVPTATSAPTGTPSGKTVAVTITTNSSGAFEFSPATITIKPGTTVIWTNMTRAPHTVTSDDGKTFDSGINNPIMPDATFKFTFTTAGSFSYHCQIHPYMKATIVVQ